MYKMNQGFEGAKNNGARNRSHQFGASGTMTGRVPLDPLAYACKDGSKSYMYLVNVAPGAECPAEGKSENGDMRLKAYIPAQDVRAGKDPFEKLRKGQEITVEYIVRTDTYAGADGQQVRKTYLSTQSIRFRDEQGTLVEWQVNVGFRAHSAGPRNSGQSRGVGGSRPMDSGNRTFQGKRGAHGPRENRPYNGNSRPQWGRSDAGRNQPRGQAPRSQAPRNQAWGGREQSGKQSNPSWRSPQPDSRSTAERRDTRGTASNWTRGPWADTARDKN